MTGVAETLPDYLAPGLRLVSVGLNPSLASVRAGFYFANPRNRFWRALNRSGLLPDRVEPGRGGIERLFRTHGIGFTDLVKRATPGAGQLRAADFQVGAPRLRRCLLEARPVVAWFHGKLAWRHYLRWVEGLRPQALDWGLQSRRIDGLPVFVTPNPSPANAVFSLDDLVAWYDRLAVVVAGQDAGS